jgi:uncharacterized protein
VSAFADSSALVKLYVPEVGHESVRDLVGPMLIATIARVEVPAAFWGKVRTGELAAQDAATLTSAFEYDYHGSAVDGPRFTVVRMTEEVLELAARLAARHGLRAYDAVQLGCAITARGSDDGVNTFAAFDRRLSDAALAEGFAVVTTP